MTFEITRTELVWPGKYDADGNLTITPPANLPFQVVERVNETKATREARENREATLFDIWEGENEGDTFEDGWRNKLIWGDNKLIMESLLDQFAGKVDFFYIDPPYDVGADFSMSMAVGNGEITKDASVIEEIAFRDTWGRGRDSYVMMISERLKLVKQMLSPNGVVALHSDWRVVHHIRAIMDEIFGSDNFINEVIWRYGKMSNTSRKFPQNHDNISIYSNGPDYIFNPVRESDSEYKNRFIRFVKDNKVHYGTVKASTDKLILGRIKKKQKELNRDLVDSDVLFDFDSEFKTQDDVFYDISIVKGNADEKIDYPTQKPEALISRLLSAFTHEGALVADVFCGSGTTQAVAEKMNRRWIGADLGRFAIHTTRKRLLGIERCKPFDILNLGKYERQYWSNVEFGDDLDGDGQVDLFEYVAFILKLYGAVATTGSQNLHGKKGRAFVHVGSITSPITIQEVDDSIKECAAMGATELHILGWEWEMGLMDTMTVSAKSRGVKLFAKQIPREVMEVEAARKGQIEFYELAYLNLVISPSKGDNQYYCSLDDFMISNPELIPNEIREKITKWSDYVDYWAIDWNFQNDTFMPVWMDYRTKQDRTLRLETDTHIYEASGIYKVMVKVVDIFGNDTSKIVELKVK